MASQCFPKAREKFGTAQLNWTAGTIRCVLMSEGYTPDFTAEFLSDLPLGPRIAVSEALHDRSMTNGYAGAAPIKFPLLQSNLLAFSAVIYRDTGDELTSDLIFLMESPELVTAPFPLLGFDYYIYPNSAVGGFFRL